MATYKTCMFKTPKASVTALTTSNALKVDVATRTGDTVASIVSVSTIDLDGVNLVTTVAYTV